MTINKARKLNRGDVPMGWRQFTQLSLVFAWLVSAAHAAPLNPKSWIVQDLSGKRLTNVTDGNLETVTTLRTTPGLLIDLGQSCTVHRVFLTGRRVRLGFWPNQYENREKPPLGLVVISVGDTADTKNPVAEFTVPYDAGNPIDDEIDVRFPPTLGRYVRIELRTKLVWGEKHWPGHYLEKQPPAGPADLAWNVAEVELYGFPQARSAKADAVVLPKDAPAPLRLAAEELEYYLGELSGKPHPVIAPEQAKDYSGTLYEIVDLKPLALTYEEMLRNRKEGKLPEGVNVERDGRRILFKAWPYRCVLWSVWEFLERQGIRWLYPDAHGEDLPSVAAVKLDMLPLKFMPSARSIYASWDTSSFHPWPNWMKQSQRQGYLYPWRNRWNFGWEGYGPLGGPEIPVQPVPATADSRTNTRRAWKAIRIISIV